MITPARWVFPQTSHSETIALAKTLKIALPAARVLWHRGYRDAESAHNFLEASLNQLHDPLKLRDMDKAVARLGRAINNGEKILLYGDYDVDGAVSVVILKKAIELAGGEADYHVPDRLVEGYGMHAEVIEKAAAGRITLVVSVDTGIRAAETVARANELGIDVIVTDHHLPDANLPPAYAIVNPNQPQCNYPNKNLCGAGVALKLVQALLAGLGWSEGKLRRVIESLLKMVAIATVADVVPLIGENRAIVKHGLDGLATVRNPGLRALLDVAGFKNGERPTAGQVAFRLAPRINAAGRMANVEDVIQLFLTEDLQQARVLASRLHALNQERQQTQAETIRLILEDCSRTPVSDHQAALVFSGEGWHRGVVGIVASRMAERFHRPTFVLSVDHEQGEARGSGRSIPAFHLLDALESMQELFTMFGGHKQAAGLTIPSDHIEEFRQRLNDFAVQRLSPEDFIPVREFDARLDFDEISDQAADDILSLAPFGLGNPSPLFSVEDVEVAGAPIVFKEKHLRVRLQRNGKAFWFKAWNFAERIGKFTPGARMDVALRFESDPYSASRGFPGWGLLLRDVK